MDKTKIIERIQKLLALSTSDNVNEAAAAAAAAQKLMVQYDIEQAALDVETSAEDSVVDVDVLYDLGSKTDSWKGVLAMALCEANGAKVYINRSSVYNLNTQKTSKRSVLNIIGTKDQANTCRYLFAYLVNEVERLARASEGSGRSWHASFKLGAAGVIGDRLKAAALQAKQAVRQEAADQASQWNSGAIVRVQAGLARIDARTAAIAAHARKLHLRSRRCAGARDGGGYAAGKAAGATVRLGGGPSLGKGSSGAIRG